MTLLRDEGRFAAASIPEGADTRQRSGAAAGWRAGGVAAALIAATAALVGAQAAGADLGSPLAGGVAITVILGLGVPHGALDLRRLAADPRVRAGPHRILGVYLAAALAMAAAWIVSPPLALALFLVTSIGHFASEAAEDLPWVAALPFAGLLIATPAASHPREVAAIFVALGGPAGESLARFAAALAPLLAVALGLAALLRPPRATRAWEAAAILAGLALLPPLPAFAVFFGLQHSPRHFRRTAEALNLEAGAALRAALPATVGALGLGAALVLVRGAGSQAVPAAAFMLLSVLTVPHMSAGALLRWSDRAAGRRTPVRRRAW